MSIQLIKATADDAENLVSIQKKAFKRLYDIYKDERSPYLKGTEEIFRWLNNPNVSIYKIHADEMLCGGIAVFKKPNDEYYLARLYVLTKLQRQGIASKVIKLCEACFDDAKKWMLDFPADQIANKKCYEKAGYIDTGIREVRNEKLTLAVYEKVIRGVSAIREAQLERCAAVIRRSFATVADEFGLTEQNCPNHTSFINVEKLQNQFIKGCQMFGYFSDGEIIGYVSLTKNSDTSFEMNNLSVLPEFRHKGYGKELLDICKSKVKELGANKITIGIIEENTKLKEWYTAYGFIHTGTRKFGHLPFTVGFMELNV
jgi:ribosomal protein S18 acetylase RimI-like enzyme